MYFISIYFYIYLFIHLFVYSSWFTENKKRTFLPSKYKDGLKIKYFKRTQAQVLLGNSKSCTPVRKRVLDNEYLSAEIA